MRLLLVTDSPFATSAYAQQGLLLAKALNNAGHTVIYYGHTYPGVPMVYQGVQIVGNLSFGLQHQMRDLIAHYIQQYNIDCVLTFKDPVVLDDDRLARLSVPWIAFAPVDTEPASRMLIQSVQHATRVITPTKFAQAQFAQQGVKADYAPHAVDTDFFTPDAAAGMVFRRQHGIGDDTFLVSMVANNQDYPSRKSLDQALIAFIAMMQHEPTADVTLWLHTDMLGARGGVKLHHILMTFTVQDRWIRFTDQTAYEAGCTPEFVRDLYRASNVLLAPSEGEGFCVPVIEAAACGTPSIVTNSTALREVARAGWRIPSDTLQGGEWYWCPLGGMRFKPTQSAITEAIRTARHTSDKNAVRNDARQSAMRYNLSEVMAIHWIPLMAQIEAQIMEAVLA
jgi:glycosyltransferase involved in cell wall biosynthesis